MKPIERGYKIGCITDTNGYVYTFDICAGKKNNQNGMTEDIDGLGGAVVASSTDQVKEKNHKIFFNNFYSSIPLMEYLQGKKILACGTMNSTRKDFPPMSDDKILKRGDFNFKCTAIAVSLYKWKDRRIVHFVSNYHEAKITNVTGKEKDGREKQICYSQVVKNYNQYMGGVHKHDML